MAEASPVADPCFLLSPRLCLPPAVDWPGMAFCLGWGIITPLISRYAAFDPGSTKPHLWVRGQSCVTAEDTEYIIVYKIWNGVLSYATGVLNCHFVEWSHLGPNKMAIVWQTTTSNTFWWKKMFVFSFQFHWNLVLSPNHNRQIALFPRRSLINLCESTPPPPPPPPPQKESHQFMWVHPPPTPPPEIFTQRIFHSKEYSIQVSKRFD